MSRRYHARTPVFVEVAAGLNYGFNTNLIAGDQAELGQAPVTPTTKAIFGASRPKPIRYVKEDGSASSFGDAALGGVPPAGWKRSGRGKLFPVPSDTAKTVLVYISIDGTYKWCWNLPKETQTRIGGDQAALGIKLMTGADKAFFGANYFTGFTVGATSQPLIKIPQATKLVTDGTDGTDMISTYYEPGIDLPAGWKNLS